MAEESLVDDQIDGGQMAIDQLLEDGFDVPVAFWIKTDEGFWRLHIASPSFDDRLPGENSLKVYESLRKVPDPEVRFWPIYLINDQNPAARAALKIAGRPGKKEGIRYQGTRLGDLPIEEAYIYPRPAVPLRQDFMVSYVRQGRSNEWSATVRTGPLHRWVRHSGVVSTAYGPGDKPEDAGFVLIHVWIEIDPSLDERRIAANPIILTTLVDQARTLADEIFKGQYPEATIHHHDMALAPA
jgi:hypothetical protein